MLRILSEQFSVASVARHSFQEKERKAKPKVEDDGSSDINEFKLEREKLWTIEYEKLETP